MNCWTWTKFQRHHSPLLFTCLSPSPSLSPFLFQIEDQNKILAAKRSNNELNTTKLCVSLPDIHIPDIHEACEGVRREGLLERIFDGRRSARAL